MYYIINDIGSATAKVTINIPASIVSGQPTSGSCVASGNDQYFFIKVKLVDDTNNGQCSIKMIGGIQKLKRAHYQQKFNITCDNADNSVEVKCFTHVNNDVTKTLVQGKLLYYTYRLKVVDFMCMYISVCSCQAYNHQQLQQCHYRGWTTSYINLLC